MMARFLNDCPKESPYGGMKAIRITHWNVNGLSSKLGSKLLDPSFVKQTEKSDIILLTETHETVPNSISLSGYYSYQVNRRKHENAKKGSGGVAILVKNSLKQNVSFIQSESCNVAWMRLDHKYVGHSQDVYVGAVYISPLNSTYRKNIENETWDILEKEVEFFSNQGFDALFNVLNFTAIPLSLIMQFWTTFFLQ
jgi:exonuclease III